MRMRTTVGVALGLLAACSTDDPPPGDMLIDGRWTEAEWDKIQNFGALEVPPPANPTNKYADNPAVAALGQSLFFDKRFAGPLTEDNDLGLMGETGKVSCTTCHNPQGFFQDTRPDNKRSHGAGLTGRNTPSLVNVVYYEWGNWAGAHDQFWKQGANGAESRDNFNGNRLQFAHFMYEHYRSTYDSLFPIPLDPALDPDHPDAARFPPSGKPKSSGAPDGAWEMMAPEDQVIVNTIMANVGKSFEAYERLLISKNSPLDRYIAGDFAALNQQAKRGLALFIGKAACHGCHSDTTFSDQKFHNTGLRQTRDDQGRYEDLPKAISNTFSGAGAYSDDPAAGMAKLANMTQTEEMRGQFRTKSLRHIAETAPYMHDGSLATLEDVVRFYNRGGDDTGFPGTKDPLMVPLNLTDREITDLVEFLRALTGEPVPAALTVDTSAP